MVHFLKPGSMKAKIAGSNGNLEISYIMKASNRCQTGVLSNSFIAGSNGNLEISYIMKASNRCQTGVLSNSFGFSFPLLSQLCNNNVNV